MCGIKAVLQKTFLPPQTIIILAVLVKLIEYFLSKI